MLIRTHSCGARTYDLRIKSPQFLDRRARNCAIGRRELALARNVWRGSFAATALARALSVPPPNLCGVPERRRTDVAHRFRCVAVATCDIAAERGGSHAQVDGALLHGPLLARNGRRGALIPHNRLLSHVASIIQHCAVNYSTVMLWQR